MKYKFDILLGKSFDSTICCLETEKNSISEKLAYQRINHLPITIKAAEDNLSTLNTQTSTIKTLADSPSKRWVGDISPLSRNLTAKQDWLTLGK